MKIKALFLSAVMATVCLTASAQHFRNSRYYNRSSDRLDYSQSFRPSNYYYGQRHYLNPYSYVGLRVGASFSDISDDRGYYNDYKTKTGLNIGLATGFAVSHYIPLYLETGLYYTEKGGKSYDYRSNLNYLEVPLVLKYNFCPSYNFSIQPFAGGYLACGVSGKTKYYDDKYTGSNYATTSSFGDNGQFNRFDGGLKVGCGISYDVLYAELSYEYGLSNINKDSFDSTHNSAMMLNVGLNF